MRADAMDECHARDNNHPNHDLQIRLLFVTDQFVPEFKVSFHGPPTSLAVGIYVPTLWFPSASQHCFTLDVSPFLLKQHSSIARYYGCDTH